ncbi:glycosylated lysosomal membrane protein [Willisornis vidua]|uniref:Glycosylated lysosomal membrane protein n=1 Tax=Willisornis vidua TaxID=1566151 RepID=A0ABQ9DBF8_9PASS|nr:glycosylated lysosomal membrane protein [Willisornis vidua]
MAVGAGLALLAALVATGGAEQGRKVSMEYNPGWNSSAVNLLHVRAQGPRDTLHYVWSSIGAPAVLLVATDSPDSSLSIDWPRLLSPSPAGAVRIEPPGSAVYATAVVFTKVTAYEAHGRARRLPSLLHTPDSSQVEFVLAGVAPRGNSSRFMLEVATVEAPGVAQSLRSERSIDDEYTPTIFEVLSLVAESRTNSSTLSFLQWKATAYGSRSPGREDGIRCQAQGLQEANWTLPPSSIVQAYFGEGVGSTHSVSALNISFGGEEGRVYQEKRYLSWSVLLGFGQPPTDTFSPLVISIMAVALGTPLAMLLVGTCLVLLAQRKRYSEYEPIN